MWVFITLKGALLIVSLQNGTHGQILPVSAAHTLSVTRRGTYACLDPNQVSGFYYQHIRCLTFASRSAAVASTQLPEGRNGAFSSLNAAIEALDIAEETSNIVPVKAVFGSVSVLLTMIKVRSLLLDPDVESSRKPRTQ